MSLGKIGAFCGCGEGMGCCDCQGFGGPVPLYRHNPPTGFGAGKTAGQTNYWPSGIHRRYAFGRYAQNQSPMHVMGMRGFGAVELGGGWTIGDAASLSLIVLTVVTLWRGTK